MSLRRRGRGADALNPWPGYVDALSTLLMVIIFVLLVFVLGQAFLSVALTGKDRALDQVSRQLADLTNMLSLERSHSTDLQSAVAGLSRDLAAAAAARDQFATQAGSLQTRLSDAAAQQDALRAERDRLSTQAAGSAAQAQSAAARMAELQRRIADSAAQLGDARRQAADAKAELDQVVVADRATIEAKLAGLAHLNEQVQGLAALRDTLRAQVEAASAQAEAEARGRAGDQAVGDAARAQVALLNRQVGELRAQLAQVSAALDMAATAAREQDVVIANLGAKLNTALASKVEELQHYRSEFFGRLRDLLANRPGVQVVGDRFVFQSEVLFPPGSADMTAAGQDEIRTLASTLKGLAGEIPAGIPWIMRVDGHADRTPVGRGPFASNWELSSERAINVVKLLVGEGVPAGHLAATGFAEFQPLDGMDTPDAYARNRRIELRLTDR